jgi:hypothetical protein
MNRTVKALIVASAVAAVAAVLYNKVVKHLKFQVFRLVEEDDDEEGTNEHEDAEQLDAEPDSARAAGVRSGVRSEAGLDILNQSF